MTASNIARLRNDKELAKEALRQDGTALRHVSDTLQGCKDIVKLAVCQARCSLRRAQHSKLLSGQPQIRADTDVNRAAVKANGRVIASDRSFWWAPCEDILADAVHTHANTIGAIESQGGLHQMCPPPSEDYGGRMRTRCSVSARLPEREPQVDVMRLDLQTSPKVERLRWQVPCTRRCDLTATEREREGGERRLSLRLPCRLRLARLYVLIT